MGTTGNSLSGIGGIGGLFASLPRIKKKRPGEKIQPTSEDPQGLSIFDSNISIYGRFLTIVFREKTKNRAFRSRRRLQ